MGSTENGTNGLDKFLGELSEYKAFAIKFLALIFHDDIMHEPTGTNTYHNYEVALFWILIALLTPNLIRILIMQYRKLFCVLKMLLCKEKTNNS